MSKKNTFSSKWLINLFKKVAYTGYGSDKCLKYGFLPTKTGIDSPIPDLKDLQKRKIWNKKSELKGIDFREGKQIVLLEKIGKKYGKECNWPPSPTGNEADFFVLNYSFLFGCAASTHSIIREFKPKKVIEIGSGYSSLIISKALTMNKNKSKYFIVDPYPLGFIQERKIKYEKFLPKRVELIDPKYFDQLSAGDVLFIDSGHAVRIGSDVNYLYLEVLPRLKPGVIIHSHDIFLPYNYPKFFAQSQTFRQFWTESYLMQAFLIFNNKFEILLAMNYLMRNYQDEFKKLYPSYDPKSPGGRLAYSPSFWMRKK